MLDKIKYKIRIENEKKHYSKLLHEQEKTDKIQKIEPKVDAFTYSYKMYSDFIIKNMPHFNLEQYVLDYAEKKSEKTRILSLGSGTGDWEIAILEKNPKQIMIELQDINEELLKNTKSYADKHNLEVKINISDANEIKIDESKFDFIICRSSMHHFIELEHIFLQVNNGLIDGGEFLVMGEVIGRNGEMLFLETKQIAQKFFNILPSKFRYNQYTKKTDIQIPDIDHSKDSFESIRSEEIFPLLKKYFKTKEHVAFDGFLTLLLDFRYGPNYDINNPLDKSLVETIANLDLYYISNSILKPTCLFGIFEKR